MDKIFRYYISEIVSKSVANSQMFNWGEVLEEKGIKTDFVIFYRSKEKALNMIKDTKQNIIKIPVIKFFIVRNLVHFFALLFLYFRARIKYKKIIFQTRTQSVAPSLAILRILPGLKVITDIRGLELEQYDKMSFKSRIKLLSFDFYTWLSLRATDKIFCVSNPLVNIIAKRYNIKLNDSFNVFGGVADEKYFFYDEELRNKLRKENILDNKILLIYSGMLDKPWQMPEKYFEFFVNLTKEHTNLVLILLTPNTTIANNLKVKYDIDDANIIIKETRFSDLVNYYNMADFGLLFRKDEIVNRVASPTKFSEYALCGLPIIISDNIGDFSDYIRNSGFGYVIKDTDNISKESLNVTKFISAFKTGRTKIGEVSKNIYSKQSQVSRLISVYKTI